MTIRRHEKSRINYRVVEHDGVLHFGGLIADDLTKDMKGQTEEICAKFDALLAKTGSDKTHLLTAVIYITDFDQKEGMNDAWLSWIAGEDLPTRATIGVAELGRDVLVEIVISAAKPAAT